MNCIAKVGRDKIGLKLPLRGVPQIFDFPITGAHQDALRSGAARQLHIDVAIAHDKGSKQIDGVLPSCPCKHTCFWLAAIAVVIRNVWAIVNGFYMRVGGSELLDHEFVDRLYKRLWKIASANAGLIRDDNHGQPSLIQAADRLHDMRQDTKSADMIQVADFFANGAIAIEKNGGA